MSNFTYINHYNKLCEIKDSETSSQFIFELYI
jgi:hypothetical protein